MSPRSRYACRREPIEALADAILHDVPDLAAVPLAVDPRVLAHPRPERSDPVPGGREKRPGRHVPRPFSLSGRHRTCHRDGIHVRSSGGPFDEPALASRRAVAGPLATCRHPPSRAQALGCPAQPHLPAAPPTPAMAVAALVDLRYSRPAGSVDTGATSPLSRSGRSLSMSGRDGGRRCHHLLRTGDCNPKLSRCAVSRRAHRRSR